MIFKMFGNIGNFRRIIKTTNVLFIRLIAPNHRKTLRFHRIIKIWDLNVIKNMGFYIDRLIKMCYNKYRI